MTRPSDSNMASWPSLARCSRPRSLTRSSVRALSGRPPAHSRRLTLTLPVGEIARRSSPRAPVDADRQDRAYVPRCDHSRRRFLRQRVPLHARASSLRRRRAGRRPPAGLRHCNLARRSALRPRAQDGPGRGQQCHFAAELLHEEQVARGRGGPLEAAGVHHDERWRDCRLREPAELYVTDFLSFACPARAPDLGGLCPRRY